MSFRIIAQSVFNNPGNRDRKLRKALAACWWQIRKRVTSNPQTMILANGVRFQAYPHCVVSSALHYADWPEYYESGSAGSASDTDK